MAVVGEPVGGHGRRERSAGGEPVVPVGHVGEEHRERPAVADDVVDRHEQAPVAVAQPGQQGAEGQLLAQVRDHVRLVGDQLVEDLLAELRDRAAQVHAVQLELLGGPRGPGELAPVGGEPGQQHGMRGERGPQRGLQRLLVQRAAQPQHTGHVVGRPAGVDLVQEPEPLLRGTRGHRPGRVHGRVVRGGRTTRRRRVGPAHGRDEVAQPRVGEHRVDHQPHVEQLVDPVDQGEREQRVPAQLEEAVVPADGVPLQQSGPERPDRRGERVVQVVPSGRGRLGCREVERPVVDLARPAGRGTARHRRSRGPAPAPPPGCPAGPRSRPATRPRVRGGPSPPPRQRRGTRAVRTRPHRPRCAGRGS